MTACRGREGDWVQEPQQGPGELRRSRRGGAGAGKGGCRWKRKVGKGLWRSRGRGGGTGGWCVGEEIAGGVRASRAETEQGQGYGRAGTSKMDGIQ